MPELTVLTPAYNRDKELHNLFESLCRQTDKNFEWLIVDDGSTDGTSLSAAGWKEIADFPVFYYKKENGGKHTALNYALKIITSPLVFIVDSDDRITPDAIKTILEKYSLYKNEQDICGFSFLREKPDGSEYLSGKVPVDGMKSTYCSCRINGNLAGDMAEVWYTEKLREFPFPEFKGEKFLGEDAVWVRLSGKYKMRFFNKAIYISQYQNDGLTKNRRRHNIKSPNGCVARASAFLGSDIKLKYKTRAMLQYFIYGKFAGNSMKDMFLHSDMKPLAALCFFPAMLIYINWKHKFAK